MTSPTGSGKTTLFGTLASQVAGSGQGVLINVHRRELATQAANRLREFGAEFGLIMAGEQPKPYARIQIASVQSLVRRKFPRAALVINDEAHLSTAKTWATIMEQYPNARILGATATPWRMSGKPLVGAYDASVLVATPNELRKQGHLCEYVGFSYLAPDLSKVKTTGGDYNERQSSEAMRAPQIVDNIVERWLAHASHLSTVVFAVTVDHSKDLCARFCAAGVAAEHLDGATPKEQRKAILRRVEEGVTRVLCNVGVAVEGLDIPRLKCCVLARPTKSLARAIQMMGRVRRPWNGEVARIHDHAFVIGTPGNPGHGLPDDDRDYSLNARDEKPLSVSQCEECMAYYRGPKCTACDHENAPRIFERQGLATVDDAESFEFSSGDATAPAMQRPPVDIQWTQPGRELEGVLLRRWEEATQYGPRKRYLLQGTKRIYSFPGTTELNALLSRVPDGSQVKITHTRNDDIGRGKVKKRFSVEKDDGIAAVFA